MHTKIKISLAKLMGYVQLSLKLST